MTRRDERGFSLIEVLFAIAILTGVLLSIASLMVMGGKNVWSGQNQSEALAAAGDVLEELGERSFSQAYGELGIAGTVTNATISTELLNSGTPPSFGADLVAWHDALKRPLGSDAYLQITFESLVEGAGTPPNLEDALAVRVEVRVNWNEFGRQREVLLCTVRV